MELTIADASHDRVGAGLLTRSRFADFSSEFGEVGVGCSKDVTAFEFGAHRASAAVTASVANGEVFTTGSWYDRLGRAVAAGTGAGSLSGRFQALEDSVRQGVT